MGMECKKCKNYIEGNKQPYRCPVCADFESYEKTKKKKFIHYICDKCGTKTKRLEEDEVGHCYACDENWALIEMDISQLEVLVAGLLHMGHKYDEYRTVSLDCLEEDLAEYLEVDNFDLDWSLFGNAVKTLEKRGVLVKSKVVYYNW